MLHVLNKDFSYDSNLRHRTAASFLLTTLLWRRNCFSLSYSPASDPAMHDFSSKLQRRAGENHPWLFPLKVKLRTHAGRIVACVAIGYVSFSGARKYCPTTTTAFTVRMRYHESSLLDCTTAIMDLQFNHDPSHCSCKGYPGAMVKLLFRSAQPLVCSPQRRLVPAT